MLVHWHQPHLMTKMIAIVINVIVETNGDGENDDDDDDELLGANVS